MADFKEQCRIYYMVKGDLTRVDPVQIKKSYDSYFRRMWNNNERFVYSDEKFEKNYRQYELVLGSAHMGV